MSYILVYDALYLHGLHDVGDELWVSVGVSDLLVQQSSDAALRSKQTNKQKHTNVTLLRSGGVKKTYSVIYRAIESSCHLKPL